MDAEKQKFLVRELGRLWEEAGVEGALPIVSTLAQRRTSARALGFGGPPPETGAERSPARPRTLDELRRALSTTCRSCSAERSVFGAGEPKAPVAFVGERPTESDRAGGLPFLGPEGALLGKILEAMGRRREAVYLTTLFKCRPGTQSASCASLLTEQIAAVGPQIVVALGDDAAAALTGSPLPVAALRGKFHPMVGHPEIAVMPTFSLSHLLAEHSAKRLVWEDMKLVMSRLQMGRKEPTT